LANKLIFAIDWDSRTVDFRIVLYLIKGLFVQKNQP